MAAVSFISCINGKSPSAEKMPEGSSGLAIRKLCGAGEAKSLLLPSGSPEQRAEVDSWLDFAASFTEEHLPSLNKHLRGRSFLAGGDFSAADVVVFFACAPAVAAAPARLAGKSLDLCRWFNQVQHRLRLMAPSCQDLPPTVPLGIFSPVTVPLPPKPSASAAAPASAPPGSARAAGGDKPPESAAVAGGGKKDKKEKSKGGEGGVDAKKGAAAEAPGAAKKKGGGAAAPPAAAAAAPAAVVEGEPSKLDVRVGVIVKAWEHPDSDKLFCEEIDLGEGTNRMIASGLRAFYSLEEMQGRRVIVLANLKPRNIGGFKSNGMVLCASAADKSAVKIIEPPPGAAIGARVTVSGTEGEPATPAQVQKKKILEKCAPKLKTNSDGLPGYDGVGVFNVDGEPCVATIPGASVSKLLPRARVLLNGGGRGENSIKKRKEDMETYTNDCSRGGAGASGVDCNQVGAGPNLNKAAKLRRDIPNDMDNEGAGSSIKRVRGMCPGLDATGEGFQAKLKASIDLRTGRILPHVQLCSKPQFKNMGFLTVELTRWQMDERRDLVLGYHHGNKTADHPSCRVGGTVPAVEVDGEWVVPEWALWFIIRGKMVLRNTNSSRH
eukprot:g10532.t1